MRKTTYCSYSIHFALIECDVLATELDVVLDEAILRIVLVCHSVPVCVISNLTICHQSSTVIRM